MIGKVTSIRNFAERNVELVVTLNELQSQVSSSSGPINPRDVDHYEITGLQEHDRGLVTLILVLADGRRVRFYSTESKFDMTMLLDQLDGTIGVRPRNVPKQQIKAE